MQNYETSVNSVKIKRIPEYAGSMSYRVKNGIPFLQFKDLQHLDFITHGFSTRAGGVSQGIYSSMSFKEDCDDPSAHVRENYRRMAEALECDVNRMVRSRICHGTAVHEVGPEDGGQGVLAPSTLGPYDGLITNRPGITLAATFADCVPLYLVDPVHRAIGLAHSGWKGTANKIALEMVRAMQSAYGTRPEELLAAIGPCICGSCYEVSEDLREAFRSGFSGSIEKETGICFADIVKKTEKEGKYLLDLRLANQMTFLHAGIIKPHLLVSDICTCCNPELIFSHRYTQGRRGLSAAFLGIREP